MRKNFLLITFIFLLTTFLSLTTTNNALAVKCVTHNTTPISATMLELNCGTSDASGDSCSTYTFLDGMVTTPLGCTFGDSATSLAVCMLNKSAGVTGCGGNLYDKCKESTCDFDSMGTGYVGFDPDQLNGTCTVSTTAWAYASGETIDGYWDTSGRKCVTCNGKKEKEVCGDSSGLYFTGGPNCGALGDGKCETACGADTACDEVTDGASITYGGIPGTCTGCEFIPDATGVVLSGDPTAAAISSGDTENIEFIVKDSDGNNINGATVTITKSGGGSLSLTSCTTNSTGKCDVDYTAGTPGAVTITATAEDGGITSNQIIITINVDTCPAGHQVSFDESNYEEGDTIKLDARGSGSYSWSMCIYDEGGNLEEEDGVFDYDIESITTTGDSSGTWTGVLEYAILGTYVTCESNLSSAGDCRATTTVFTPSSSGPSTSPSYYACNSGWATEIGGTSSTILECSNASGTGICDLLGLSYSGCNSSCTLASAATSGCTSYQIACGCGGAAGPGATCAAGDGCLTGCTPPDPDCSSIPVITPVCDPTTGEYCNPVPTINTLVEAGVKIIQAILGLIGTIALLFFIIAGIMYITAGGEEEKINSAKRMLTGTVIGLGIALISFSLLQVIVDILG